MDRLVLQLSKLLLERKMVLACAESCTGGMFSMLITEQSGSSKIFDRGFVTYSNEAKQEMLGVSAHVLEVHGAVSAECAEALAAGVLNHSSADVAVSITGIAGPDGGSTEKPVGLVYIAVALRGKKVLSFKNNFKGARKDVREQACQKAFEVLIETVS